MNFIEAKRDVTLAVMTQPKFCLHPLPPGFQELPEVRRNVSPNFYHQKNLKRLAYILA